MRILVTGAQGFVGGYLLTHLRERGDEVTPTCEPGSLAPGYLPVEIRDVEQVEQVVADAKPDAIIHLAAIAFVPEAEHDFTRALDINVGGVHNLCRAISRTGNAARLVFASSPEVYGKVPESQMPLSEDQSHNPANNYGLTKSFAESVIRRWRAEGVPATIIRPFNHIGPRQNDRFVTSSFARQLAQIKLGLVPATLKVGNLDAKRDFTDVRDIVQGYRLAAEKGGDVFQLCSGKPLSVQSVLDRLIQIAGVQVVIERDPERMRTSEIPLLFGSNQLAADRLGWIPTISLDQTLQELFDYWLSVESAHASPSS